MLVFLTARYTELHGKASGSGARSRTSEAGSVPSGGRGANGGPGRDDRGGGRSSGVTARAPRRAGEPTQARLGSVLRGG